jgi:miniconductance mechanosensitive channel
MLNNINFEQYINLAITTIALFVLAFLSYFVAKKYITKIVQKSFSKIHLAWGNSLVDSGFFNTSCALAPVFVFLYGSQFYSEGVEKITTQIASSALVFISILLMDRVLSSVLSIYNGLEIAKDRPIKGYVQLAKLVIYILGAVIAICTLFGISPWGVISGIGAFTAILIFVFKDTILSFVASVQITSNNLFKVGDWLQIDQFGADGEVVDIALHSVQIQNWDKTITTIPTHKFMDNSFKNWQGMASSGVRRIKRKLFIDFSSIKPCSDKLIESLKDVKLLNKYLQNKSDDIKNHNADGKGFLNQRKLTNIGVYREYVRSYLEENKNIDNKNSTFLIRQLQPTSKGLPLEIYVFTNDNRWVEYEKIQSDIFDHLIVALAEFDLKIYQEPTGAFDIKNK